MRVPKYRPRPDRDYAFVEMNGERIALPGRINSAESLDAYRRLLNEYLRQHANDHKPERTRPSWDLTITELVSAWLDHCKVYYASANTRSNEYQNCRYAVRPLVALFGDLPTVSFAADDLRAARDAMISGHWTSQAAKRPIKPWPRSHANAQVNRIKRMFRWGLDRGLVSPEVSAVVGAVAPLRKGRTIAKETDDVSPVDDVTVDATLPHLSPLVADMVRIQRLTGMRSDNLCAMRPCDIDRSGDVWLYRPPAHKGGHREKPLAVPLGPRCQSILLAYMQRSSDAWLFNSKGTRRYTTGTYRNAVRRAAKAAGVPHWFPHQLRHSAVQRAKAHDGLEGARAYVGHTIIKTTEIYEERDLVRAVAIARAIG
jgi:integrase